MDLEELEKMKLTADIFITLKTQLAPEDIEHWRDVCLDLFCDDEATLDFINICADLALKPECMKK